MRSVHLRAVALLFLLRHIALAEPAATRPSEWPSPTKEILVRIHALLRDGNPTGAEQLLNTALQSAPEPLPASVTDGNTVTLCDLAAVTHLRLHRPAAAYRYAKVAAGSPGATDGARLNLATAELQLPAAQIHALDLLANYCDAHPSDEAALDLFGVALDRASGNVAVADQLPPYRTRYDALADAVDQSHKGERRWGTTWVNADEFTKRKKRRRAALDRVDDAQKRVDRLRERVIAASRDDATDRGKKNKHDGKVRADDLHAITKAKEDLANAQNALDRAKADVPPIPWNASLTGILPAL